jgi:hypothetical protein
MAVQQTLTENAYLYNYARNEDSFSIPTELKHLFSTPIAKLFFYPLHIAKQRFATQSLFFKTCKTMPHFPALWKTIQGGSFAYNTLLLGITPLHKSASKTIIADLTCLAILFGDEFIDGISQTAGKAFVTAIIKDNKEYFYLQYRIENGKAVLYYRFDVRQVIPSAVLEKSNEKYAVSYNNFYDLLLLLLQEINNHLAKLTKEESIEIAGKITTVCNACFDTYVHDIEATPVQLGSGNITELLHFHKQKNQPIQYQLLELRCMLAKRLHVMEQPSVNGWLNIIAVMQYYDDMLDAAADDDYQDNVFLNIAMHKAAGEYDWFKANKNLLAEDKNMARTLSVHMPCSVFECMKLIGRMVQQMDWQQQKICNYLLRKNWFVKERVLVNTAVINIASSYQTIAENMAGRVGANELKAYMADWCFHSATLRQQLFANSSLTERYEMRLNMLLMTIEKKCRIFDKAFPGF